MNKINENDNDLVELGTSTKPHGIKGGFLFKLVNSDESVLSKGSSLTLFPLNESSSILPEGLKVIISAIHFGNKTICYIGDIKDRNIVEAMLPFSIHFLRSSFPKLEEGQWYLRDLIDLDVYDQDGYKLGKVESFYENGAQVVLKLNIEGEKMELPFVEAFFPYLDIKKNKIVFIRPEYD